MPFTEITILLGRYSTVVGIRQVTKRPSHTTTLRYLLALADHLKVERFAATGVSGGGPYALACWHRIPRSRLAGLGIMSDLYPTTRGLSEMILIHRALFFTAQFSPWLVGQLLDVGVESTARKTKDPGDLEQ
ncbi:hypothetical protein F5Y05DRAFT_118739 [Hypoxylon sp. FL0543]|nr:hypothetical protein F5Y05DRAFT_118739 [Hypoxylon sp. FL0543]